MKVLFIANGYPSKLNPNLCPFIESQAMDLKALGLTIDVLNVSEYVHFGYLKVLIKSIRKIYTHDVVHIHHGLTFILIFPLILLYRKKKFLISFLNNIELEFEELRSITFQRVLVFITKQMINLTDVIVIEKNDNYNRQFKNYHVVPNGVNLDFYKRTSRSAARSELGIDRNTLVFLFVSSKSLERHQKRLDRFQELMSLSSDFYGLHMSGIEKSKTILYYSASDYLVVTSELEGSPNAVKESVACGTPVLTLDVGDVRSILKNEMNSRIFSSFAEMREFFRYLAVDTRSLTTFDGHELIVANGYSSRQIANRLLEIYQN